MVVLATLILAPGAAALHTRAAALAAARGLDHRSSGGLLVVGGDRHDLDGLVGDLGAAASASEAAATRVLVLDGTVDLGATSADAVLAPALAAPSLAALVARTTHGAMLDALIDGHGVQAVYQPVIEIRSGLTVAFEALLRLEHAGRPVPPVEVFRAAAETGRLAEADAAARAVAIAGAAGWIGGRALFLNLEAASIERPTDVDQTMSAVIAAGLEPRQITFEATLPSDPDHRHVIRVLEHLRARGFGIALDDVTGDRDDLALVDRLRPDAVKIARTVIAELPAIPARSTVAAIVGAAHAVGARVVAKGIESPAQLDAVLFIGVDDAQGWQVGQPMRAPGSRMPAAVL